MDKSLGGTQAKTTKTGGVWSWVFTIVLILLTGISILVATQIPKDRTKLMNQAFIGRLCQHIDCRFLTEQSAPIDLAQLKITHATLYQNKSDGQFRFRFSLSNTAEHTQPLPTLKVRMFDAHQKQLAQHDIVLSQVAENAPLSARTSRKFNLQIDNVPQAIAKYTAEVY